MNRPTLTRLVAAVIATEAVLLVFDTGPNVWLVAALVMLAGTTTWFATSLTDAVVRPTRAPSPPIQALTYPDLRTTALRQALATGHQDARHAERLRERLVAVVDDELVGVHGIDRSTDPEAARVVLGRELDDFVSDPGAAATLTPRSLTRIVTLIERI